MQLSALAEGPYEYEYRHVSGCDRWISLRAELSRSSERLAKIPLDALVMFLGDADDEFFYINTPVCGDMRSVHICAMAIMRSDMTFPCMW